MTGTKRHRRGGAAPWTSSPGACSRSIAIPRRSSVRDGAPSESPRRRMEDRRGALVRDLRQSRHRARVQVLMKFDPAKGEVRASTRNGWSSGAQAFRTCRSRASAFRGRRRDELRHGLCVPEEDLGSARSTNIVSTQGSSSAADRARSWRGGAGRASPSRSCEARARSKRRLSAVRQPPTLKAGSFSREPSGSAVRLADTARTGRDADPEGARPGDRCRRRRRRARAGFTDGEDLLPDYRRLRDREDAADAMPAARGRRSRRLAGDRDGSARASSSACRGSSMVKDGPFTWLAHGLDQRVDDPAMSASRRTRTLTLLFAS